MALSHLSLNNSTILMMSSIQSQHLMARDFHKGMLRMKNLMMMRTKSMNGVILNHYGFYVAKCGRVLASEMRDLMSI